MLMQFLILRLFFFSLSRVQIETALKFNQRKFVSVFAIRIWSKRRKKNHLSFNVIYCHFKFNVSCSHALLFTCNVDRSFLGENKFLLKINCLEQQWLSLFLCTYASFYQSANVANLNTDFFFCFPLASLRSAFSLSPPARPSQYLIVWILFTCLWQM